MKERMYCYAGDLSGFKNINLNLEYDDLSKRVDEWIEFVELGIDRFGLPRYKLVSDTVYAGAEYDDYGLEKLIGFARYMMEEGVVRSFPTRGAISFGDVNWDKNIPTGKGLIIAINLANDQDWIGTSCDHKIDIENLWSFDRLFVYPVPMKDGLLTMYPVVSWNVPPLDELRILTALGGLAEINKGWEWKLVNRVQNTTIFSLYLKLAKAGLIKQGVKNGKILNATPNEFAGINPMEAIEHYINIFLENFEIKEL